MLGFVIVEIGLVAAQGFLLYQAEMDAQRAEHVKEIIGKTNRLVSVVYDVGTSMTEYAKNKDEIYAERYQRNRSETLAILDWLKTALKDDPESSVLIVRVDNNLRYGLGILDKIKNEVDTQPFIVAIKHCMREKMRLQPTFDSLVKDLLALVKQQRKIEEESPFAQRAQRELQRNALIAGLVANVVLAFAGVGWFTKNLTSRLTVLVDNAGRMKTGDELNAPLSGSDEIAVLDSAFHNMAFTLRLKEEMLKESEQRVRSIIEKIPVGLVVFSKTGAIEFVNPTLESMFLESADALVGRSLAALVSRSSTVSEGELIVQLEEKALDRIFEITCLKKNGEQFPVEFSMTDFETQDGSSRLGILLDVSERQEVQRMRQAFVSMVSHELRTPLTAVSGFLSLLEMGAFGELPAAVTEQAGRAEANVARLMKLISDLLDLEKMDSGTLNVSKAKCELKEILQAVDEASRTFADSKGVKLVIDELNGKEFVDLYADADRLVQVLVNLISNAVKFSPPDGTVQVAHKIDEDMLEMRVIDQGRGVPAKYKELIFERFQQVEANDAKQKGGTGLGLAICKTIVEIHGGTIAVDSEEGKGSTFWFRIKRNKEA